jgi:integrase
MRRILTDGFVRAAKPPVSGRLSFSDLRCAGLSLRIAVSGVKSWSFLYRVRGSKAFGRVTMGQYPALGLSAARSRADALRQEVAGGGNPAQRMKQDRAAAGSKSFGALAERYMAEHSRRKKRSHKADERNLHKHVLPHWRNRPYASVRRGDVIELVESIISDGKETLANRVQGLISSVFTFALDAGLCEANPCHRLRKRGRETPGRRVLTDAEIRLFWDGIVTSESSRQAGLGLRIALLTGARVGEVAGISRAELENIDDPARAAWIIPGTRTKNRHDHLIPLAPLARDIVLELLALIGERDQFLVPTRSRRRRGGPMRGSSLSQRMADFGSALEGSAAQSWKADLPSAHDLRRTVGTRLAELRIPKEIRDRCLNHIPSDVGSKHYNLYDFAEEKRDALNRWDSALSAILKGGDARQIGQLAPCISPA